MATWDDVIARVARAKTVNESALVFIAGMKDKIDALKKEAEDAAQALLGASTPEDYGSKFDDLIADLDAQADKLASAITENTPAAPVEAPVELPLEAPVEEVPAAE